MIDTNDLDNNNNNNDHDKENIGSTSPQSSLSLRQKLLSAQILDEQIGYDDIDVNNINVNDNDDITNELEQDVRLNINTLQEMDDVIANLKNWHINSSSISNSNTIESSDNDKLNLNINNRPETNDDDDNDDDDTNIYTFINNVANGSNDVDFNSNSITSVLLNKYFCQTKERDISPEKLLEKLESLRKLIASKPCTPRENDNDIDYILKHPITGIKDNNNDDNNIALIKRLEKDLDITYDTSSWSQVHTITGEGLELEMDIRSLEANLRDFSDDLDKLLI